MKTSLLLTLALFLPLASGARAQEEELKTTLEKDWVTISVPEIAHEGEEVTAEITVREGAIEQDSELGVDLHTMVGTERQTGKGHAPLVRVSAGEAFEHTATFTVREGVDRVAFIVYLLPAGESLFKTKTHAAEIWVKIVR